MVRSIGLQRRYYTSAGVQLLGYEKPLQSGVKLFLKLEFKKPYILQFICKKYGHMDVSWNKTIKKAK